MKNWAPEKTWKGENSCSLLNIGQQLQDTNRREQKIYNQNIDPKKLIWEIQVLK